MNSDLLEEILSCPSLPSLPAVALRVIDLTADPNVKLHELADTIQNDQGLAAKILRTVNSSYYALRAPCASIQKALVLLGLAPVKTLALGFSLVSSLESKGDTGFDYASYWRRGLYSAVGAKAFAESARSTLADEAFLAGLLQDIGQMAMYRALKGRYVAVLDRCGKDHRALVKAELDLLEIQHPDIGAMLAQRWKLPQELVMAVRYHERPTAAPPEHAGLARFVALGQCAHDVLTDPGPRDAMRRLYERASQWLGMEPAVVDDVLKKVAEAAKEVSRLFKLDTGAAADAEEILKLAQQRREQMEAGGPPSPDGDGLTKLVTATPETDALTGVLSRQGFDGAVRGAFASGYGAGSWTSIVQIVIDSYGRALTSDKLDLADEAILGVAGLLSKHFEPRGGVVCRLSKDVFAVVASGQDPAAVGSAMEGVRQDVNSGELAPRGMRVCFAVASAGPGHAAVSSATELVIAATKALQAQRKQGSAKAA